MKRPLALLIAGALLMAGCGSSSAESTVTTTSRAVEAAGGSGLIGVTEADLAAVEAYFAPIAAEAIAFDELRAGDGSTEAIRGYLEGAFSPEIVVDDALMGERYEGYDQLVPVWQSWLSLIEGGVVGDHQVLMGNPTALQWVPFWGMTLPGSGGVPYEFTEDEPYIEVDLFEMDGDRIGYLLIFMDLVTARKGFGDLPALDGSVQERYAAAWTSGDRDAVAGLYADDATRRDGLAGVDAAGIDAIVAEAGRWFEALPDATWRVRVSFAEPGVPQQVGEPAERYGDQAGAVFGLVHDACTVDIGILLDLDDNGAITQERVYYDPATLRACGWVS